MVQLKISKRQINWVGLLAKNGAPLWRHFYLLTIEVGIVEIDIVRTGTCLKNGSLSDRNNQSSVMEKPTAMTAFEFDERLT